MSKQEFIDKYLNKTISKKLTVFLISCYFAYEGKITGSEWITISTAYIGLVAFTETILKLRDK
jgi:hypothetical protein